MEGGGSEGEGLIVSKRRPPAAPEKVSDPTLRASETKTQRGEEERVDKKVRVLTESRGKDAMIKHPQIAAKSQTKRRDVSSVQLGYNQQVSALAAGRTNKITAIRAERVLPPAVGSHL